MIAIKKLNKSNYKMAKKPKKMKKVTTADTSGMGMKPNKTYTFTSLNVEKNVQDKKVVKEKDVFELPKKKSGY
jgi:hypothetical protein|tara:strand:- start:21 stop:239 length:219 start_codon:yes stop_codon:yes gene_type:complete